MAHRLALGLDLARVDVVLHHPLGALASRAITRAGGRTPARVAFSRRDEPTAAAVRRIFFVAGALGGMWAARLLAVAAAVGVGLGELSLLLVIPQVASMLAGWVAGRVIRRDPGAVVCRVSLALLAGAVASAGVGPTLGTFAGALVVLGFGGGSLNVAMNAHGLTIERALGQPLMGGFHAAYSAGACAGALAVAAAIALGLPAAPQLTVCATAMWACGTLASSQLPRCRPDASSGTSRASKRSGRLWLGAAVFCCWLTEGAIADWSGRLATIGLGASPSMAAACLAAFACAMWTGRGLADVLGPRWGADGLLRRAGLLAALSFFLAFLIGDPLVALPGFAGLGLGLSPLIPVVMRWAGTLSGDVDTETMAAVASIGFGGFLVGPLLVGGLATHVSVAAAGMGLAGTAGAASAFALRGLRKLRAGVCLAPQDDR